ncbi:NifU family protein [Dyadobacter tibetensis]|uniref:NifU family protein n=1 Tax=Dyadobacter tibetensis TaxID=1211851 RepID=UPI00046FF3B1|nr:NifU family protein [Dyadobacter tibetensis]
MDSKEKTIALIELALESVRPYLKADGGDVRLIELTDNQDVVLELLGSCQSCPMSAMTFRAGLEESIRKAVPSVNKVVAQNVPSLAQG